MEKSTANTKMEKALISNSGENLDLGNYYVSKGEKVKKTQTQLVSGMESKRKLRTQNAKKCFKHWFIGKTTYVAEFEMKIYNSFPFD